MGNERKESMRRRRRIVCAALIAALVCTMILPASEETFAAGSASSSGTADSAEVKTQAASKNSNDNYTGWRKIKGHYYYYKNGKKLRGIQRIGRYWVRLSPIIGAFEGVIGDNMDLGIQKYSSRTKYLMVVSCKRHELRVYKGKKNRWRRIKRVPCTTGKRSTPTIKGQFTIKAKGRYFNTGSNGRCWYYTQFKGNYLFHSVIYNRNSRPNHIIDGRLGISASHGCVRLSLKNAKWVYKYMPRKTKVVIY